MARKQSREDLVAQEPECYANGLRVAFRAVSGRYLSERFNALVGYATTENGFPVVYYDAETLSRTPPVFSRFVLHHEGAHHILDHQGRREQEYEADGLAFKHLHRKQGYGRLEIEIIRETNERLLPPHSSSTHPSVRQRYEALLDTYERLRHCRGPGHY